tara:strand:+ start:1692 stop:2237 length:546 start_codon:yes stop_codon:yes gene_type:complete
MLGQKSRYWTVTVQPTCYAGSLDDGDNIFLWTEIPNACPRGGTSFLKAIQVVNFDDADASIDLYFAQTKDADATVTGALGAASTIVNMTDAEVSTLKPLTYCLLNIGNMNDWDFTNGRVYTTPKLSTASNSFAHVMHSHEATQAQVEAGTANPGSVYVMAVGTATKTYSASGLKFRFTFES